MKKFLPFLVALVAGIAYGATGTATLSWTPPTTYVDGSALAPADISGFPVNCTFTPTGGTAAPCQFTPTSFAGGLVTGTVTLTALPAKGGNACFFMLTTANGVNSDPSNTVCKPIPPIKPSAPGNLTITIVISIQTAPGS